MCPRESPRMALRIRGASPLALPSTLTRGGPMPRSIRVARSLRSLATRLCRFHAPAAVLADEPIGPAGQQRVQHGEAARNRLRIHLGPWTFNGLDDRVGDFLDALLRAEAAD